MSRSRESRPRGSRKQQTKIIFAARAPTLNRYKLSWGTGIRSLTSFSLALRKRECQLHWLPVDQRIEFKVLLFTYEATQGLARHQYLSDLLEPYSPLPSFALI